MTTFLISILFSYFILNHPACLWIIGCFSFRKAYDGCMRLVVMIVMVLAVLCGSAQAGEALPEAFLGNWVHDDEFFRLVVYPDGTMKDFFRGEDRYKNGERPELMTLYEYKVLYVKDKNNVVILFREKEKEKKTWSDWSKPLIASMRVQERNAYDLYHPILYIMHSCSFASQAEWENPSLYQKQLLDRANDPKLNNENYCSFYGSPKIQAIFIKK